MSKKKAKLPPPPQVIWLRYHGDDSENAYGDPDEQMPSEDWEYVPWCNYRISGSDVRYVIDENYGKRKR